jgi:hypothetical protein
MLVSLYSPVLSHPSSVGHDRFYMIEHTLWHNCSSVSFRQDTIVDRWFCRWFGIYIYLLIVYRVPTCTSDGRTHRGESSVYAAVYLHRGQWVLWVLSSVMGLDVSLWQHKVWQQPVLFGNFHRTPLAKNSIRCKPILVAKALFGDKRCLLGLCLPHYLEILCRSPSCIYFREASTTLGFHNTPQVAFNFSCLFT